jgi:hypothetical protein
MRFLLFLKMATGEVTLYLVRRLSRESTQSFQPGKELVYLFSKIATGDVNLDLLRWLNIAIRTQLSAR